jgi:hypothetical protein
MRLPIAAISIAISLSCAAAAEAAVLSSTPSLPPLGVAFTIGGSGNCFPAAGTCAVPGTLTFDSVVASPPAAAPFNTGGQDILANATLTGTLTDFSSHATTGSLLLTGTIEMEIDGRTFDAETGSWQIELMAIDLEGPALGHTLRLSLDATKTSTGRASITASGNQFLIDSFFDVFADLSLDSTVPLNTTIEAHITLPGPTTVAAAEPASAALLAVAVTGLVGRRARRVRSVPAAG